MNCWRLALAIIVTALWDVVLRLLAKKTFTLIGIENISWVRALEPYFDEHTVLGAALLAGAAGAAAFVLIESVNHKMMGNRVVYTTWVFIASAVVGVIMRYSQLFPKLNKYYYDMLPTSTTVAADGFSGLVVAGTIFLINNIR